MIRWHDEHAAQTSTGGLLGISIVRTVPSHKRPFAEAVNARSEHSSGARATATWRLFATELIEAVSERWSTGIGLDLLDGDVRIVSGTDTPTVDIVVDAPHSPLEPMQIRSFMQVIEKIRPAMRREAPVSTSELDAVTADIVVAALGRYPLVGRPGDQQALLRLHHRYGWDDGPIRARHIDLLWAG